MIVWWSQKIKNKSKNKQKDAPSLCDKVFQMKTEVRRVQTESTLVQWGCSPHPQAYGFHHPWITHGACSAPTPELYREAM